MTSKKKDLQPVLTEATHNSVLGLTAPERTQIEIKVNYGPFNLQTCLTSFSNSPTTGPHLDWHIVLDNFADEPSTGLLQLAVIDASGKPLKVIDVQLPDIDPRRRGQVFTGREKLPKRLAKRRDLIVQAVVRPWEDR